MPPPHGGARPPRQTRLTVCTGPAELQVKLEPSPPRRCHTLDIPATPHRGGRGLADCILFPEASVVMTWGQNRHDLPEDGRYLLRNTLTAHRTEQNWTCKVILEDVPKPARYHCPLVDILFFRLTQTYRWGWSPSETRHSHWDPLGSVPPGPVSVPQVWPQPPLQDKLLPQTMLGHRGLDPDNPIS